MLFWVRSEDRENAFSVWVCLASYKVIQKEGG